MKLRAYGIPLQQVKAAIQRSNNDVGGRVLEMSESEFMVRGLGYVKEVRDLEQVVLGRRAAAARRSCSGTWPTSASGPEIRRGLAEWNGEGETVGGIVVVRFGATRSRTIAARQGEARGAASGGCPRTSRSRSPTTARR